jgi:hypothetical protein
MTLSFLFPLLLISGQKWPKPTTLLLLGSGLFGLAASRKRLVK